MRSRRRAADAADASALSVRAAGTSTHRTLVAARRFAEGEVILEAQGMRSSRPTRLSLQVGVDEHIDVPPGLDDEAVARDHPWRFLNHACTPTAWFRGRSLVAMREIARGEEITFDYETTEWELASPFACRCGTKGCTGRRIRGYATLSPEERARRAPFVGPWLLARAVRTSASATGS